MKTNWSVRFVIARFDGAVRKIIASPFKTREAASEPLFIGAATESPFDQYKSMKTKSITVSFALAALCASKNFASPHW